MHKPRVCHQKGLRTEAPDDSGQREDRALGLVSDRPHHFLDAADLVRRQDCAANRMGVRM